MLTQFLIRTFCICNFLNNCYAMKTVALCLLYLCSVNALPLDPTVGTLRIDKVFERPFGLVPETSNIDVALDIGDVIHVQDDNNNEEDIFEDPELSLEDSQRLEQTNEERFEVEVDGVNRDDFVKEVKKKIHSEAIESLDIKRPTYSLIKEKVPDVENTFTNNIRVFDITEGEETVDVDQPPTLEIHEIMNDESSEKDEEKEKEEVEVEAARKPTYSLIEEKVPEVENTFTNNIRVFDITEGEETVVVEKLPTLEIEPVHEIMEDKFNEREEERREEEEEAEKEIEDARKPTYSLTEEKVPVVNEDLTNNIRVFDIIEGDLRKEPQTLKIDSVHEIMDDDESDEREEEREEEQKEVGEDRTKTNNKLNSRVNSNSAPSSGSMWYFGPVVDRNIPSSRFILPPVLQFPAPEMPNFFSNNPVNTFFVDKLKSLQESIVMLISTLE